MLRWRFCLCVLLLVGCATPDAPISPESVAADGQNSDEDAAIADPDSEDAASDGGVWCGTQKLCADNQCAADCAPKIRVTPATVVFYAAKPGAGSHVSLRIHNDGHETLRIGSVAFTSNLPGLRIDAFGGLAPILPQAGEIALKTPALIAAGDYGDVALTALVQDYQPIDGTLTLYSNDPMATGGTVVPLVVNQPCLELSPSPVEFGYVKLGNQVQLTTELQNPTATAQCITGISLQTNWPFSVDFSSLQTMCPDVDLTAGPTAIQPCCLGPGKSLALGVTYAPNALSPPGQSDTTLLQITVKGAACPPLIAQLLGNPGTVSTCPIAQITVIEGDEVVPQTTLHLKGDGSKGANGAYIKSWKWTVKQPAGSNKGFNPAATFPNPTFTPDAAGEYEFCLDVIDANGVKSCAQACQKVQVVPNNAVHVELLWYTPSDPDQSDTGVGVGADMDLHFAHYLASGPDLDCDGTGDPWFSNPFDCFWFNNSPQWGAVNSAIKDDPTLDLDDTDGAGPENLNLEHPEGDPALPRFYSIGAHYWNDHGYGMSFATVTVYLFGAVALKIDKISMQPLDMWYVGKLNWPNQLTGTSMPPLTVCYQTKGSKPGDVCKGTAKMWQASGESCITPCYVNSTFVETTGGATPQNCK
jgi:hypothetical protein